MTLTIIVSIVAFLVVTLVLVVLLLFAKAKLTTSGDVTIDTVSRTVLKAGTPVELTLKEYELLLLFVRNRHIALFRETIFQRVWQSDYLGDTRTIDLHVRRLRKKLGWERELKTVYKIGYRLEI